MTTTYNVKLISQTNAAVLIFSLIIIIIGGIFLFIPEGLSQGLSIVITGLLTIITYFLWQKFVTGRSEWMINDDGVKIEWTKPFPMAKTKNIVLKWSEIEKISKGLDPHYYNLKIKLRTGERITFFHDYLTTKDDFDDLIKELYQTFQDKNTTETKNSTIRRL